MFGRRRRKQKLDRTSPLLIWGDWLLRSTPKTPPRLYIPVQELITVEPISAPIKEIIKDSVIVPLPAVQEVSTLPSQPWPWPSPQKLNSYLWRMMFYSALSDMRMILRRYS